MVVIFLLQTPSARGLPWGSRGVRYRNGAVRVGRHPALEESLEHHGESMCRVPEERVGVRKVGIRNEIVGKDG